MEGVRFRETPEQARERQFADIDWKLSHGAPLSRYDYDLLEEREMSACAELRAKIEREKL